MMPCGQTHAPDAAGGRAGAWVVRLSSFKVFISVNVTTSADRRRTNALAELNTQAANLRREIAGYQVKIEFYASECSDGAKAYEAEMGVHIAKAEASLCDVERLINELEATPVQLSLL